MANLKNDPPTDIFSPNDKSKQTNPPSTGLMELNLPELAFCLLSESNEGIDTIPLTQDGKSYVSHDGQYGLPTATARHVVMSLLAMHKSQNNFNEPVFTFELRKLVQDFIQGGERNGRASGKDLHAAKRDLYRLAHSRIHYHRWWNKELQKHTNMDTSIIDFVEVIEKGSASEPCLIKIGWGQQIFASIKSGYLGTFDFKVLLRLKGYLDKALFFFLSKHLYWQHDTFEIHSCQNFARFKLGMQGKRVEQGGRTASSYIVKQLEKSLKRVNEAIKISLEKNPHGRKIFAVRMTVDSSSSDYSLCFERISGHFNSVIDRTQQLILFFIETFFEKSKTYRIKSNDRTKASEWIKKYGYEKARWMVKRCKTIHLLQPRTRKGVYAFSGLFLYEKTASSDFDKRKKSSSKQREKERQANLEKEWSVYASKKIDEFIHSLSEREKSELHDMAEKRAKLEEQWIFQQGKSKWQQQAIERSHRVIVQEKLGLNKEEFIKKKSEGLVVESL